MKNLFKVALLALAIALPLEDAEACDKCESTQVWVDAYRDSHGALHEGHWKIVTLCHQPAPPPRRPLVVLPTPVIRIGHSHHRYSTHHRHHTNRHHSSTRSHSTHHRSHR